MEYFVVKKKRQKWQRKMQLDSIARGILVLSRKPEVGNKIILIGIKKKQVEAIVKEIEDDCIFLESI